MGGACGELIDRGSCGIAFVQGTSEWSDDERGLVNRVAGVRDGPASGTCIENRAPGSREDAVDAVVPICCFCSKVRDDTNREVGKGPWVDLTTYAISREVPLGHRLVFSHGYCPDCIAHFDERMAAYRPTPVRASLGETGRRLVVEAGGSRREREH